MQRGKEMVALLLTCPHFHPLLPTGFMGSSQTILCSLILLRYHFPSHHSESYRGLLSPYGSKSEFMFLIVKTEICGLILL